MAPVSTTTNAVVSGWLSALGGLAHYPYSMAMAETARDLPIVVRGLARAFRNTDPALSARLLKTLEDDPYHFGLHQETSSALQGLSGKALQDLETRVSASPLARRLARQVERFKAHCDTIPLVTQEDLARSWSLLLDVTPTIIGQFEDALRDKPQDWSNRIQLLGGELDDLEVHLQRVRSSNVVFFDRNCSRRERLLVRVLQRLRETLALFERLPERPDLGAKARVSLSQISAQMQMLTTH